MENKVKVNEENSQFELETPEGLALIAFEMDANILSVLHTEVPEAVEGQGVGSQLAKFALDYARENQLKVVVPCRFVQVFLHQHPEYQDLIVK